MKKLTWTWEKKKILEEKLANFPPPPVLPPLNPLIKISGIVEEISIIKAKACFDLGAYSTMQDKLERKQKRDKIGTIAAMAAQALADTPPHVGEPDDVYQKQNAIYIKGKINGKNFSGWVETIHIKSGEYIEMSAVQLNEKYIMYAVTVPGRKTAFLPPKCYSRKGWDVYMKYIYACMIITLPIFLFLAFSIHEDYLFLLTSYITTSIFLGLFTRWNIIRKDTPYWELYELINKTLPMNSYKIKRLK